MVFGFAKKQITPKQVVGDLVEDLMSTSASMDEIAQSDGIASHSSYRGEREALQYILGWLAIQTSTLKESDKHRFSAELTGTWVKRLGEEREAIESVRFLQDRIQTYRDTLAHASAQDWAVQLVSQFLGQLNTDSEKHMALVGGLSVLIAGTVDTATNFISSINKDFKFS
jgi:hypothetical protein